MFKEKPKKARVVGINVRSDGVGNPEGITVNVLISTTKHERRQVSGYYRVKDRRAAFHHFPMNTVDPVFAAAIPAMDQAVSELDCIKEVVGEGWFAEDLVESYERGQEIIKEPKPMEKSEYFQEPLPESSD